MNKSKQGLKDFIKKMTKNAITDEEWFILLRAMYEPGIIEQFVEEGGIGSLMHLLGEKVTVKYDLKFELKQRFLIVVVLFYLTLQSKSWF